MFIAELNIEDNGIFFIDLVKKFKKNILCARSVGRSVIFHAELSKMLGYSFMSPICNVIVSGYKKKKHRITLIYIIIFNRFYN